MKKGKNKLIRFIALLLCLGCVTQSLCLAADVSASADSVAETLTQTSEQAESFAENSADASEQAESVAEDPADTSEETENPAEAGTSSPANTEPENVEDAGEPADDNADTEQETAETETATSEEEALDVNDPGFWDTFHEEYADDGDYIRWYNYYHSADARSLSESEDDSEAGIAAFSLTTKSPFTGSTYQHNEVASDGKSIAFGIDVSKWQGTINWAKVKASGVTFAIIRCGNTSLSSFTMNTDPYFATNVKNAKANGIKVGAYYFSQAKTTSEAKKEAQYALNLVKAYSLDLPVFFDEEGENSSYRFQWSKYTKTQCTNFAVAFCDIIKNGGYAAGVYNSVSKFSGSGAKYDVSTLQSNGYPIWVARYNSSVNNGSTTYALDYFSWWQYTDSGTVSGISGAVDCDFWYIEEQNLITYGGKPYSGLYRETEGGILYLSTNGILTPYNGQMTSELQYLCGTKLVAERDNLYYYQGKPYTGLFRFNSGGRVWVVKNGVGGTAFTGQMTSSYTYICNYVKTSIDNLYYYQGNRFTGLFRFSDSGYLWYVKDGKGGTKFSGQMTSSYTYLYNYVETPTNNLYYYQGKLYTGLFRFNSGGRVWVVKNGVGGTAFTGQMTSSYTYICNYVKTSIDKQMTSSYTYICNYVKTSIDNLYYYQGNRFTGLFRFSDSGYLWYVKDGKGGTKFSGQMTSSYTYLYNYVETPTNNLYYYQGKLYTGLFRFNSGGRVWVVKNGVGGTAFTGQMTSSYTYICNYAKASTDSLYYYQGNRFTGLFRFSDSGYLWYVKNGKGGTKFSGRMTSSYTYICNYVKTSTDNLYYYQGKPYTGLFRFSAGGRVWVVKNGVGGTAFTGQMTSSYTYICNYVKKNVDNRYYVNGVAV